MPLRNMAIIGSDKMFHCSGSKPAPIWEGLVGSNTNPMTEAACLMLFNTTLKEMNPADLYKQLGGAYCNQSLIAWFCAPKNEKRHEKLNQIIEKNPRVLDFLLFSLENDVLKQQYHYLCLDLPSLINLRTTPSGNALMNLLIERLIQKGALKPPQAEAQRTLTLELVKYHNVVCTTATQLMHSTHRETWSKFKSPEKIEQQRALLLENNRRGIEIWNEITPSTDFAATLNHCLKITSPEQDLSVSKQSFYGIMMEIEALLKTVDISSLTAGLLRELRDRFMSSKHALSILQAYSIEGWDEAISDIYESSCVVRGALNGDIKKMQSDNELVEKLWNEKVKQTGLISPECFSSQHSLFQAMDSILASLADQIDDPDNVATIRQTLATANNAESKEKFISYAFTQLKGLNIDITTQSSAIVRQIIGWVETEKLNCNESENEDFYISDSEDPDEDNSESPVLHL